MNDRSFFGRSEWTCVDIMMATEYMGDMVLGMGKGYSKVRLSLWVNFS